MEHNFTQIGSEILVQLLTVMNSHKAQTNAERKLTLELQKEVSRRKSITPKSIYDTIDGLQYLIEYADGSEFKMMRHGNDAKGNPMFKHVIHDGIVFGRASVIMNADRGGNKIVNITTI